MDTDHEHPAGSRLRQRQISANWRSQQPVQKITLAQQWQAGDSIWSRPAIRVFATYAKWDEEGYVKNGNDVTKYAAATNSGISTTSRGDSDEWSFGAQMSPVIQH